MNEKYADCDWQKAINTIEHHTDEYVRTDNSLVVRRGQPFKFTARLNRPFASAIDVLKIYLKFGPNPTPSNGTAITIEEQSEEIGWYLTIDSVSGNDVTCSITSPPDALIGRYKCGIHLETNDEETLDEEPDIIMLCNPWCEEDEVYLSGVAEREEYVLNQYGAIWRGTVRKSSPCPWIFGQFEDKVLDTALHLIMNDKRIKANKGISKAADPVWVSRILSAGANCSDDNGVLTGNWTGDYSGGVSPVTWNSSVNIIQQYAETKRPVKYGQCWVFSGLTTTLLRAVGIPARSVTNFASAHDTDNTMTIDDFVHEDNEKIEGLSGDSVWNFHVWNEAWLNGTGHWPKKYAGWAAIDATPQEESFGMMQCGPAPIKAVKEGEIYIGYDSSFVFGEVNADRVTWICKTGDSEDSVYVDSLGSRRTKAVGFNISTKPVGGEIGGRIAPQILTDDYKYPESSEEERRAWQTAYNFGSKPHHLSKFLNVEDEGKVVNINISTVPEVPVNGEDLTVNVTVENVTEDDISISLNTVLYSCLYTGQKKHFVTQDKYKNRYILAQSGKLLFDLPYVKSHGSLFLFSR